MQALKTITALLPAALLACTTVSASKVIPEAISGTYSFQIAGMKRINGAL